MNPLILFADGASSGNPGPGGWGTILVYQTDKNQEIQELGGRDPRTTNNRMELVSVIAGLRAVLAGKLAGEPIRIHTDSSYVIRGISQWIHAWKRNGWKTAENGEVLNRDLWEQLEECVAGLRKDSRRIEWISVPGHSGIPGNERVDEIAVQFSKGRPAALYRGPLSGYAVRVLEIPSPEELEKARAGKPYYISYVDGELQRHESWAECEARVKGKKGARFKKVGSAHEEREILRSWRL